MIKTELQTIGLEPMNNLQHLKIGDLADVTYCGVNHIVLRSFQGFVSLTNPIVTWHVDAINVCRILPKGTVVKLTVE